MHRHFFRMIETLRASYWFIPSVMAILAAVLGAVMVWLDAGPAAGWLDGLGWYQSTKPDGAQQVLSTIAGSMITVAGVVFSITIVAISFAASQYGPRILTNFMSDRGNQVTLGTFIGTFVYCLVVLRTIRGGDEGEFVPHLAVMTALLLALCSIAVLIYFIHHVPQSIHINNVVARIGKQLVGSVQERFPAQIGEAPAKDHPVREEPLPEFGRATGEITAKSNGYIQSVDDEGLMAIASDRDLTLRLRQIPGEYVFTGSVLALVSPAQKLDDEIRGKLRRCFSVDDLRTPTHDLYFLVDELVEIAARALSPGVNDPYTAITCLDWLAAAGAEFAGRRIPPPQRVDEQGAVRVIALPQDFSGFLDRGFGRMRQYAARDMNAAVHFLGTLQKLGAHCRSSDARAALTAEAARLMTLAEQELHGPALAALRATYDETLTHMH